MLCSEPLWHLPRSLSLFSSHRDVLNFLRSGDLPPRERVRAVHKEAQYYAIGPLLEQLENMQPLKGEKVRQAFLGLMPYYKGERCDPDGQRGGEKVLSAVLVPGSPLEQRILASFMPLS